jgi:ABC-type Fe3+/spermidine/putrescine transport system ATPase subunit
MHLMLDVFGVEKSFEGVPLLRGISLHMAPSEIVCLLGPSGSGKTTLLRIISGLEEPSSGEVLWDGQPITRLPAHQRGFGLMFQDYALFPHRNVAENVAFGLRMKRLPPDEVARQVQEALARVDLAGFGRRNVSGLSGGEQQRVALARTLAPHPRLLMLDEPLGALDRALREKLLADLRSILRQEGLPTLYVTHDQGEAYAIADRLLLLHEGRVVQEGRPVEVYRSPANEWVARFLGLGNILPGEVVGVNPLQVRTSLGIFPGQCSHFPHSAGQRVVLLIRPDGARLLGPQERSPLMVEGQVEDSVFHGDGYRVLLQDRDGPPLTFQVTDPVLPGRRARMSIDPEAVRCLG